MMSKIPKLMQVIIVLFFPSMTLQALIKSGGSNKVNAGASDD